MAYIGSERRIGARAASATPVEQFMCVAALFGFAIAPFAFCLAITLWGA